MTKRDDEQPAEESNEPGESDLLEFIRSAPDFDLLEIDRIPGALERAHAGSRQIREGLGIPLEEIDAQWAVEGSRSYVDVDDAMRALGFDPDEHDLDDRD